MQFQRNQPKQVHMPENVLNVLNHLFEKIVKAIDYSLDGSPRLQVGTL